MSDDETTLRRPGRPPGRRPNAAARKPPAPPKKIPDKHGQVACVRYGKAVTAKICDRLAQGEVWFRICNRDGLPAYGTLYHWLRKHPEFAEAYAQAKEMAADLRADQALVVAQESTPATVQSDRLHVNTLQWRAAKAAPKRYGARAEAAEPSEAREAPRLIIEVRQFEKATRPDGTVYVREVLPERGGRR